MEVPDKIYTSPNIENRTWLIGKTDTTSVEYIRKEALLEWVKLAYGKVSMNPFDCSEAFDELFYKIESL